MPSRTPWTWSAAPAGKNGPGRRREREHRRWQQREARRNARADQSGEGAPYDYSSR